MIKTQKMVIFFEKGGGVSRGMVESGKARREGHASSRSTPPLRKLLVAPLFMRMLKKRKKATNTIEKWGTAV